QHRDQHQSGGRHPPDEGPSTESAETCLHVHAPHTVPTRPAGERGILPTPAVVDPRAMQVKTPSRGGSPPEGGLPGGEVLPHLPRRQGELIAARPLLERALAVRARMLGPEHPRTASALQCLGSLLAIAERSLPPDHRWTVESHRTPAAIT